MYIDIFLAVFILIGLIQGFHRGIIRTIFSIVGLIVGFVAALKFSPYAINFFEHVVNLNQGLAMILGFLLTFLLIMWGIRWLGKGLEKTLKAVKLNVINKLLGAILFVGLMIVTYSALIWFLGRTEFIPESQKRASRSYPYLMEIPAHTAKIAETVKPVFKGFWDKMDAIIHPENTESE